VGRGDKEIMVIKQSNTPTNKRGIDSFATLKGQSSSEVAEATGRDPRPWGYCQAQIVLASADKAYYVIFQSEELIVRF